MSDVIGSRTGRSVAVPDVWRLTVDAASSERDLVEAVRDYLATWQPAEIAELPESCRPGRITSGEDVGELAYRLSQVNLGLKGTAEQRMALDRLTGFVMHASDRYARIVSTTNDPFPGTHS